MQWVEWEISPARPTDCKECQELAQDNGTTLNCGKCLMSHQWSAMNASAWEAWLILDAHGRDYDTMAGNPLPLRLEAINKECARHNDTEGIRWRVLEIEKQVMKARREQAKKRKEKG